MESKKLRQTYLNEDFNVLNQEVEFCVADSPADLTAIGHLRHRVWTEREIFVPDFSHAPDGCWLDHLDHHSIHFVARHQGQIVASARLSFHQDPKEVPDYSWLTPIHQHMKSTIVSLNRLVVANEFRGHGIARYLDMIRLEYALEKKASTAVVVGVGFNRIKALKSLGFEFSHLFPEGNGLMDPEYPLGALYKKL